jgi:hypothetical protein
MVNFGCGGRAVARPKETRRAIPRHAMQHTARPQMSQGRKVEVFNRFAHLTAPNGSLRRIDDRKLSRASTVSAKRRQVLECGGRAAAATPLFL